MSDSIEFDTKPFGSDNTCTKHIYKTREIANAAKHLHPLKMRSYYCEECFGWHLQRRNKTFKAKTKKIFDCD